MRELEVGWEDGWRGRGDLHSTQTSRPCWMCTRLWISPSAPQACSPTAPHWTFLLFFKHHQEALKSLRSLHLSTSALFLDHFSLLLICSLLFTSGHCSNDTTPEISPEHLYQTAGSPSLGPYTPSSALIFCIACITL